MNIKTTITAKDRARLRKLAARQLEYSQLPQIAERRELWYRHNALKGERPMIVMEIDTFEDELLPAPESETETARQIEWELLRSIINFEQVGDDKVVSPYFTVNWRVKTEMPGISVARKFAADSQGKLIGYQENHPIKNLGEDFHLLSPSRFSVDRAGTLQLKSYIEDIFGDILPVRIKNNSMIWFFTPTQAVVSLMGMEAMLFSMMDDPDGMHALMSFLEQDQLAFARWQESEGLLALNNENDYVGAGSYGFSDELPGPGLEQRGYVSTHDLWVNMNSQESVGISPAMFGDFVFPHYQNIARQFGLVYYGCCEPVHAIWDEYISRLAGLRKVSISPWCDESHMGEALRGSRVIYSRKPSPNFVGVGDSFDETGFRKHIQHTLQAAYGCRIEFIFRDIYTLNEDRSRPARAVAITRDMIDRYYRG